MTDKIKVKISKKVFNKAYLPHLNNYARVQIFFGGSSSGKSVFLAQRAVWDILKGKRNYLICRAVARTIKRSVFQEVKKVITAWGLWSEFDKNETDLTITCNNGYQILFAGLDDVEKLKSITPAKGVITDVWLEEATEAEADDIKQLMKRQRGGSDDILKRFVLSFNPIMQSHHIYTTYFNDIAWADDQKEYTSDGLAILKTTYKDNHFLTKQDVADLENEKDKYFYDVYTLGNWGILGDVIFTNWVIADLSDPASEYYLPDEQRTNHRNGLDFGFGGAPAGMPVTHYDKNHKRIYIFKELYEYGLTNDLLANEIKELVGDWHIDKDGNRVCGNTQPVTCDSAEPKSITELQKYGVNARSAKKGKDSVNFGIQWLQQQTMVIDKRCVKSKTEIQQYQWKKDKDGNSMKVPVDKNNHIIDGLRYGYEDDMEETWLIS
jgi:phage terminase large subunit